MPISTFIGWVESEYNGFLMAEDGSYTHLDRAIG